MIRIKIDVNKLDKTAFFEGKNGALYADLTLMENRGGPDKFGNDYMVVQDLGKERRLAGERGAILGNGKAFTNGQPGRTGGKPAQSQDDVRYEDKPIPSGAKSAANTDTEDIPF